jgi:dTDP-4-amino-4,6-dideoxygalactose transaminase
MTGNELAYIDEAHRNGHLAGDGPFTKKCHKWLEQNSGSKKALLTHSCTAALEMAALLLDLRPGDEVIMPSFTFVSTANAFVLRGAVPVFTDIRRDTLNLDEKLIEDAITPRTKAICVVHYAGVSCDMDTILAIAKRHSLKVVEDAAQGIMAKYKGRPLGAIGDIGSLSFHETKNLISGEGGAILVNDPGLIEKAEIVREKGTDRSRFYRGQVDKYTWQEVGSSYLPSELIAAFLWAQLEQADSITQRRIDAWQRYDDQLRQIEAETEIRRPIIPPDCQHNSHLYYVILPTSVDRTEVLARLNQAGVNSVFHYVPLHSAPAGKKLARAHGNLTVTGDLPQRLIRLPLWIGLNEIQQIHVVEALKQAILSSRKESSRSA